MKYEIIGIIVGEILQVAFTGHVLVGRKHPPRHGYMMYAISEDPILLSRGLVSWWAGLLVCWFVCELVRPFSIEQTGAEGGWRVAVRNFFLPFFKTEKKLASLI